MTRRARLLRFRRIATCRITTRLWKRLSPRCARVFEDFVFENFRGNRHVQSALAGMIERERIPQTMLFAGLEGLGKATLARRFAARLLDSPDKIERDDLSLAENSSLI